MSDDFPDLDYCGSVDGVKVPIPHFGCLLSLREFSELEQRFEEAQVQFVVKPQLRYEGQRGEQRTMFVFDYSGNPIEFKAFKKEADVFVR